MKDKKDISCRFSDPQPELSVVMPCLNEEKTIGICIQKAKEAIHNMGIKGEIVIADNGSTDRSVEIAKSFGARVVHEDRKGYGNAYMKGFSEARGQYIIMADSDNTYDLKDLKRFIHPLKNGYDMVVGSRFKGKIMHEAMPFLHRYIGNPILTRFLNLLFKTGISDAHCGMRSFTREAYQKMNLQTAGMEFASEMIINATKANLRVTETPITLYANPDRTPHLKTFSDGWRHLRFMLLYSPDYLFMIPGLIVFFLGILSMIFIASGEIVIFGLKLGPNTMTLSSFATIVGLQIIIFSLIAKVYYSKVNPLFEIQGFTHKILRSFTLERGIGVGLIFSLLGILTNLKVLINWYNKSFGELTFFEIKIALIAFLFLTIGIELIFSSFLLSIISKE